MARRHKTKRPARFADLSSELRILPLHHSCARCAAPSAPASAPNGATPHPDSLRAQILDSLYDGVYFVDRDRRITYWNSGAERLTGFTAGEVVGTNCADNILAHVDDEGRELCTHYCPLVTAIQQAQPSEHHFYLRHKEGHRVPISVRTAPVTDELGHIIGAVEIFSDSSGLKTLERRVGELESLAYRDSLTGLPNRRYTALRVQQAIEETRQFGRSFGLVFLDVDRFKQVNDALGHSGGDAVLCMIASTLSHNLRPADLVGRWSGDEFIALVADTTPSALKVAADRWRRLVASSSLRFAETRTQVTVSVGATLLTPQDTPDLALDRADRLMFRSKIYRNRTTLD